MSMLKFNIAKLRFEMKIKTNPFIIKRKGNLVEVWLGNPDELESELVLAVDEAWLPALIATLKSTGTHQIKNN